MGPYSVLKKLSLLSIFSRFEIFARICFWPLRKGYVRERDERWKINKRKRKEKPDDFEDLPNISKYQSGKKIFEGSAKNHTLKHTINCER